MITIEHNPGQPIFDNYWKVLRLTESGRIVLMMNRNSNTDLVETDFRDYEKSAKN
jgi:hypothetical protein